MSGGVIASAVPRKCPSRASTSSTTSSCSWPAAFREGIGRALSTAGPEPEMPLQELHRLLHDLPRTLIVLVVEAVGALGMVGEINGMLRSGASATKRSMVSRSLGIWS